MADLHSNLARAAAAVGPPVYGVRDDRIRRRAVTGCGGAPPTRLRLTHIFADGRSVIVETDTAPPLPQFRSMRHEGRAQLLRRVHDNVVSRGEMIGERWVSVISCGVPLDEVEVVEVELPGAYVLADGSSWPDSN